MAETPELLLYLPRLLLYPVSGYAVMVTITFGIALWIIGYAGVWGIPAAGIVFGWMGYYFMDVVQRTAMGHAIPPSMGTEVMFQGDKLRLAMPWVTSAASSSWSSPLITRTRKVSDLLLFGVGVYSLPAFMASLALQPDMLSRR